ncbi:MAG TPA: transposase [Candidatus Nanoarchaeia archaeon]|nr:transposase [Candidatus Nanoarchaeia archaeon]
MENHIKKDKRINKSFAYPLDRELKEFCKYVKKKLLKHVKFKQHYNAFYDKNDIIDVLTHSALTNSCLESASKTIKDSVKRQKPSADSVLRYIAKFDQEEILTMFQRTFGYTFKVARKLGVFKRPVDIAIDFHDMHYYGDENDNYVVEGKPDRGTFHYFRFITLAIVIKGRRFTIRAKPVHKIDFRERLIEEFLNYATVKFKIRNVYLDAGFFDNKIIKLLNNFGLKYIIRAQANKKIKKLTNRKKELPIVMPYFLAEKAHTRLVVVKLRKKKSAKKGETRVYFMTNLTVTEIDYETIDLLYRRRWSIETSYRVKKHSLRIRTTSKNHIIRCFLFMFTTTLYNLWYLANIIVGWKIQRNWIVPFIAAKIFISKLLHIYVPPLKLSGGYG